MSQIALRHSQIVPRFGMEYKPKWWHAALALGGIASVTGAAILTAPKEDCFILNRGKMAGNQVCMEAPGPKLSNTEDLNKVIEYLTTRDALTLLGEDGSQVAKLTLQKGKVNDTPFPFSITIYDLRNPKSPPILVTATGTMLPFGFEGASLEARRKQAETLLSNVAKNLNNPQIVAPAGVAAI